MNSSYDTAESVQAPTGNLDIPDGVPVLSSLYIYVAGSCNLACRHCWIAPKFQPDGVGGPYIKLGHVEKAIQQGKPLGLKSVKLTGGEPLLHPQFRDIVTLINTAEVNIIIETNGTLIDKEMAQFLKAMTHVRFISISLDGAKAETHDSLRSVVGSYERAISGIKNLVSAGFHPQVICTLHKGNVAELVELVNLAEQLGCDSVKFNHIQQIGRGEKFQDEQGLEVAEILELFHRVEYDLAPKCGIPIYFDAPHAFFPIRKLLKSSLGHCMVRNILGMLASGELALCGIGTTVPELIYGHIGSDDLRAVWCSSPGLSRLREQVPYQLEGICGECVHRDTCLGECVANNSHITGRLTTPYFLCDEADKLGLFPPSRKKQV